MHYFTRNGKKCVNKENEIVNNEKHVPVSLCANRNTFCAASTSAPTHFQRHPQTAMIPKSKTLERTILKSPEIDTKHSMLLSGFLEQCLLVCFHCWLCFLVCCGSRLGCLWICDLCWQLMLALVLASFQKENTGDRFRPQTQRAHRAKSVARDLRRSARDSIRRMLNIHRSVPEQLRHIAVKQCLSPATAEDTVCPCDPVSRTELLYCDCKVWTLEVAPNTNYKYIASFAATVPEVHADVDCGSFNPCLAHTRMLHSRLRGSLNQSGTTVRHSKSFGPWLMLLLFCSTLFPSAAQTEAWRYEPFSLRSWQHYRDKETFRRAETSCCD